MKGTVEFHTNNKPFVCEEYQHDNQQRPRTIIQGFHDSSEILVCAKVWYSARDRFRSGIYDCGIQ